MDVTGSRPAYERGNRKEEKAIVNGYAAFLDDTDVCTTDG